MDVTIILQGAVYLVAMGLVIALIRERKARKEIRDVLESIIDEITKE